ncbi:MAG: tetratricopeptide repeat protein [Cyclobacteriaceae bacterium]
MKLNLRTIGLWLLLISLLGSQNVLAQQVSKERTSYKKAMELYDKGLYSASRLSFEKFSNDFPQSISIADAQYYRAICAVRLSQTDGEELVSAFVESYPEDRHAASAYIELAEYYYDRKSYKKSIAFFEKSEGSLSGVSDLTMFKIGHAYFMEKEYDPALDIFGNISDTEIANDAAYFQGYIYKENEKLDEAKESLTQAFDSEEYGNEALKIYTSIIYSEKQYAEVVETIEDQAPDTGDLTLLKMMGDSQFELKKYHAASVNYKEYLRKNRRTDGPTYFKIGMSFYQLDEQKDAIENFKKAALAKDMVGAYSSYYLGLLYTDNDNLMFASTAFKNASNYDTEIKEESLYAYGKTEYDLKNYHNAITAFTQYRNSYGSGTYISQVNEMLTQSYLNNEDYTAAIKYIESLGYLSPQIKKAYQRITYLKGTEYFNRKRFPQAVGMFNKSLTHQQDNLLARDAHFWIGESYSFERKYDRAASAYQKSIQKGSDMAKYGLAYSNYNRKQYDEAARQFQGFINSYTSELDKRYLNDALVRAGDCFYVQKEYERAVVYYGRAKDEGSKDLEYIHYQSGIVYRYMGADQKAISSFEKLISEFPKSDRSDDAHFQIAQIIYENGDYKVAIDKYKNYIRKFPESNFIPYSLLNQAVSYHNLNEYKGASSNYQIILDRFPKHETAKSALLGLQELAGLGEFENFQSYLDKYKSANPDSDALENIEFESAKSLYYNLQYDQAIASFEQFLSNYSGSSFTTDARYFIADSYYRTSKFEEALEIFYEISDDRDYSKYNRVIYRIATLEAKQGNHEKAVAYYHQLIKVANSNKEHSNALAGLMASHFELSSYDSTALYGKELIENHRISNDLESSATLYVGKSQYLLGNLDDAFDWLLLLVNSAPDERGAEAKYLVSKIFYDKEQYPQSLKSLFELTDTYSAYDLWMGKAFLLMSDNYLKTDELFQAEATLNSLIENSPLDAIKDEARVKLEEIKSVEKTEIITAEEDSLQQSPEPQKTEGNE